MNNYIISELKQKYQNKKIIPFIGAGLSTPFQLKSWTDLIDELKRRFCQEAYWAAVDFEIGINEYQAAIENIKKYGGIDDQQIQELIADSYSLRIADIREEVENNYIDLNKEHFKIFLTTNYDRFIEDHVPGVNKFNSLVEYTSNTQRLFSDTNEKYLFHIHGSVSNPSSIVISEEKYKELYSDEIFDNLMKAFSSSYSFLFLGFSFNDTFVKKLIKEHKDYFKGTHYLLVQAGNLDTKQKHELIREYGLKIIEYNITNSSHVTEIRKILNDITNEESRETSNNINYTSIGIDELFSSDIHQENLFYRKLEIAKVGENLREISKFFYIAAEKFIRQSKKLGLPKSFIDGILAEVFMKYKEKYVELYEIEEKTSSELLIEIHRNLENINIDRLVDKSNKPTNSESKGFIHVLADDEDKDVWWGNERL